MAGLSSFVLGAGSTALQQEHGAWIRQRQLAQEAEAERQALEARYAHERWLAERELEAQRQEEANRLALLRESQASEQGQLLATQEVAMRGTDADVRTRLEQLRQNQATEEQRRRDALRRAVAKHRASLGARNLTAAGGSSEAILLGLVNDTDTERQSALAADRLQAQALQQSVTDLNRRNLLEQSQLAERHRLQLLSRLT